MVVITSAPYIKHPSEYAIQLFFIEILSTLDFFRRSAQKSRLKLLHTKNLFFISVLKIILTWIDIFEICSIFYQDFLIQDCQNLTINGLVHKSHNAELNCTSMNFFYHKTVKSSSAPWSALIFCNQTSPESWPQWMNKATIWTFILALRWHILTSSVVVAGCNFHDCSPDCICLRVAIHNRYCCDSCCWIHYGMSRHVDY